MSEDFYSVVRSDRLKDLQKQLQLSKTDTLERDIFTPPLQKSAIENYEKLVKILQNDKLQDLEKITEIKKLNFNFNSDFEKSQGVVNNTSIPSDISDKEQNQSEIEKSKTDIHHKVLKTQKGLSSEILNHFLSNGLEFDIDTFLINTNKIEGLKGKKLYIDDVLKRITKKTDKFNFLEQNNLELLNKHFDLPREYIRNSLLNQSRKRTFSDSALSQSGSGLEGILQSIGHLYRTGKFTGRNNETSLKKKSGKVEKNKSKKLKTINPRIKWIV